jgi:predicted transcriptional regulator
MVDVVVVQRKRAIWGRTKEMAGIDRRGFFDYFAGREVGHAIAIGNVRRYREPLDLEKTLRV